VLERPEGYTWRPLGMDDIQSVYELETLGETFAEGEVEIALADVEADWRMPDFDPVTMSMGVFQDRGEGACRTDYRRARS
jgi:hypothetical protein